MDQWLLLPASQKLPDMLLLLGLIAAFLAIVQLMFNSLRKRNENDVEISTPLLGVKSSKKEESAAAPITINIDKPAPGEAAPAPVCEDDHKPYEPPKGLPAFTEHKCFALLDKALQGRVIKLKSKYAPTELYDLKNKAFSYFLFGCKTFVFKEMLQDYVDECICTQGNRAIVTSIIARTTKAIQQYESKARSAQVPLDAERLLLNIPEIMVVRFNDWHQPHIDITLNKLEEVIGSQFYGSWQLKLIAILDTFETIFAVTFDYAEYALIDLNGELDKALLENIVYYHRAENIYSKNQ